MDRTKLRVWLFGRPLRTEEAEEEGLGVLAGVPFLGLDALGSAAYGPEAALTVLLPLGTAGPRHIVPLLGLVIVLLFLVQLSYQQTIATYPEGGGSYTVAGRNLGQWAGVGAGAALWIDYTLNAAVGISAGVGALVSAAPALLPHTLKLCLGILAVLTLINLRGVRAAGSVFMTPTYLFIICLAGVIIVGLSRWLSSGGHPVAMVRAPVTATTVAIPATTWLLMRAFASGCTAMTGIEAVSDAVPVFREPRIRQTRLTLTTIASLLTFLLVGIALLARAYDIRATPAGRTGYESVLSQLTGAVAGKGGFYLVTMGAITAVLCLSANTSFADFPRICRLLARDGFLPAGFARQGSRLVYSGGIVLLSALVAVLLVVFHGLTDRLVPLFAVGAFLAFTLSQAGMVAHWLRQPGGRRRWSSLLCNGAGAAASAATLVVVSISKFKEGAWITALALGILLLLFQRVRAHGDALKRETTTSLPLDVAALEEPLAVVPLKRLDKVTRKALRFALTISSDISAVQLLAGETSERELSADWAHLVEEPCRRCGLAVPKLVVLRSDYREIVDPLVRHIQRLSLVHPQRPIVVIVPELVERRWYHLLLRNHTATLLTARLLLEAGQQVIIANAPWYAGDPEAARRPPIGPPPDDDNASPRR